MDVLDIPRLSEVEFDAPVQVAAGGGSRTFGSTVISWVPSTTDAAVTVSVSLGGAPIAEKMLTNNSNRMTYNGVSGEDWSKGVIKASFGPTGKDGQLQGDLEWVDAGDPGNYHGFIGKWSS